METAYHNRRLIAVGAFDMISCQQDDTGIPIVTIDAEIHAPLLHRRVPDDIGCPHVTIDVIAVIAALRPVMSVEVETHVLSSLFHSGHLGSGECCGVGSILTVSRLPRSLELCPTHQVACLGSGPM